MLLVIFPIVLVSTIDDRSIGQFWQNTTGNDDPYFVDWYETSELITPLVDVDLYASVFDVDNITTEITITVYYTFSSFTYENYSVVLVYDSNTSTHIYRYIYQFAGQSSVTTMRYYYQAYDGENIVREGYPSYFEITWSYPPVTIERPLADWYEPDLPYGFTTDHFLFLFVGLFILTATIFFFMEKSKKYARVE